MKLKFIEADMLAFFLREQKDNFIQCAEEFGWEKSEAEQFHKKLMEWALNNFHILNKNHDIIKRILEGENVTDVARSLHITPTSVQVKMRRVLKRANPEKYEAGIIYRSTNNYITPPLKYLRENKADFGF
jgi:predicted transcriptional regulator